MASTIAIKSDTLKMLRSVKEEINAESFDDTIRELIIQSKKPKKSMFGVFKGIKSFEREEIGRFG